MNENLVLFVDDEVNMLNALKRQTANENYSAHFTASGIDALSYIENNAVSVIVTDIKMPAMDGYELLKRVKEISPDTIHIVVTAYANLQDIISAVNNVGIFKYISKPFNANLEFLPSIREALAEVLGSV